METQEFKITGPGEYRTRDGRKVVVTGIDPGVTWSIDGTLDGEKYDNGSGWRSNGQYFGETPHKADIVAPWSEPKAETVVDAAFGPGEVVDAEFVPMEPERPAFAVGQKWRLRVSAGTNAEHNVVTIESVDETGYGQPIRAVDEEGMTMRFNADGTFYNSGRESACDLVEFVSHPETATAPEPFEVPTFVEAEPLEDAAPFENTALGGGLSDAESPAAKYFQRDTLAADMQEFGERFIEPTVEQMAREELAAFDDDREEAVETLSAALRSLVRALDRHGIAPGSEVADAHRFASLALEGFAE